MIPEVYKKFIDKIIERTNKSQAKWDQSTEKIFLLKTNDSTIEIGHYVDDEAEEGYYYFKFYNLTTNNDAGFRVSNLENDYKKMEELYYVASASAANINDELSSFLENL